MKRKTLIILLLFSGLLSLPLLLVAANPPPSLERHVLDGGGGNVAGSGYQLRSSIAQPATGISSATHILKAGFLANLDDRDGDGMPDYWEDSYGNLDPQDDLDNDRVTNLYEYYYGTKPNNSDSDNDGIPDGWEAAYLYCNGEPCLHPNNPGDAVKDCDADSLSNIVEYDYGTNPCKTDTDGDGMPDDWEVRYRTCDGGPCLDANNPTDANEDCDSDGRSNLQEYRDGTDPCLFESNTGNPFGTKAVGAASYDEVASHHMGRIRAMAEESAYWCWIERPTNPVTWNWSVLDGVIKKAEENNLDVLVKIKTGYWKNSSCAQGNCDTCPYVDATFRCPDYNDYPNCTLATQVSAPPKDNYYQRWYDFCYKVAERYDADAKDDMPDLKKAVNLFEIHPETNIGNYWTGCDEQYFEVAGQTPTFSLVTKPSGTVIPNFPQAVLPVCYQAVHDANPKAVVVGGNFTLNAFNPQECGPYNQYCKDFERRQEDFRTALLSNSRWYDHIGQHFLAFDDALDPLGIIPVSYFQLFKAVLENLFEALRVKSINKPVALTEQVYMRYFNTTDSYDGWVKENSCNPIALEKYAQNLFKQIVHAFSYYDTPARELVWFAQFPFNNVLPSSLPPLFWCAAPGPLLSNAGAGTLMYNTGSLLAPDYKDFPAGQIWAGLPYRLRDLGSFDFDASCTSPSGKSTLYKYHSRYDEPATKYVVAAWCEKEGCVDEFNLDDVPCLGLTPGINVTVYSYKNRVLYQGPSHQIRVQDGTDETQGYGPKLIEWPE